MYIQHRPTRKTSVRQFNDATASNRSGTIYRDRGTYVNTELELDLVFLKQPDNKMIDTVAEWFDVSEYATFTPYYDDDYTYRVMLTDTVEFENTRSMQRAVTATIKLSVYPFKYLNSSFYAIDAGKKISLFNPTKYAALPLIKLSGSGTITLNINDETFTFLNVTNSIEVDSEKLTVSKLNSMQTLDFPKLVSGKNIITSTANFEITPRFRRRAI